MGTAGGTNPMGASEQTVKKGRYGRPTAWEAASLSDAAFQGHFRHVGITLPTAFL